MKPFPRRKDPKEQAFLEEAIAECQAWGVDVYAVPAGSFGGKMAVGGTYETSSSGHKALTVATRRRSWFATFVHEFCHYRQDREGARWFSDPRIDAMWVTFDSWLRGQVESTAERIVECAREIALCELDCERRVLALVAARGFESIDPRQYAQQANAYVWSYEATRVFRAWNRPGRSPTQVQALWRQCPTTLIRPNQVGKVTPQFLMTYAQRCAVPAGC